MPEEERKLPEGGSNKKEYKEEEVVVACAHGHIDKLAEVIESAQFSKNTGQ